MPPINPNETVTCTDKKQKQIKNKSFNFKGKWNPPIDVVFPHPHVCIKQTKKENLSISF